VFMLGIAFGYFGGLHGLKKGYFLWNQMWVVRVLGWKVRVLFEGANGKNIVKGNSKQIR